MSHNKISFLHFSINDVMDAFRCVHDSMPESIFDINLFAKLLQWHNKYWLSFDLYVFEEKDDFKLSDLQDCYWEELRMNSWWLKLGWHQVKPGKIELDIGKQIASINRLYKLVINKCLERGWSNIVRLHHYQGEERLIKYLYEKTGVKYFLTANSDYIQSYDLEKDICINICQSSGWFMGNNGAQYISTDLCLDDLGKGSSVAEAQNQIEKRMNIQPYIRTLELFCHEYRFADISYQIEKVFDSYMDTKKYLCINTIYSCKDSIIFSTVNSNKIFKYSNRDLTVIAETPIKNGFPCFSSLIESNKNIWMIPWVGEYIYKYDIELNSLCSYRLPYKLNSIERQSGYRKAIKYGSNIWLLPMREKALLRINMLSHEMKIYDSFPKGVIFDENRKMPFKWMDLYNGYLYLFSDGCSHNIKVNATTGKMEIWNNAFRGVFGAIIDERTILISPTYEGDPVRFFNTSTRNFTNVVLPSNVWKGSKVYAFWNVYRIDNYLYILPHEANNILRVHCESKEIKVIEVPEHEYKSLRPNPGFSGYDAVKVDDEIWISAYSGNCIMKVSPMGIVTEILDMETAIKNLAPKEELSSQLLYEDQLYSLEFFVEWIKSNIYEETDFIMEK